MSNEDNFFVQQVPHVYIECKNYFSPFSLHKFENIEENIYGEDVVTFTCAFCENEHKSIVQLR